MPIPNEEQDLISRGEAISGSFPNSAIEQLAYKIWKDKGGPQQSKVGQEEDWNAARLILAAHALLGIKPKTKLGQ